MVRGSEVALRAAVSFVLTLPTYTSPPVLGHPRAAESNKRKAAGRKGPTALEGEITVLSYLTLIKYRPTSGDGFCRRT